MFFELVFSKENVDKMTTKRRLVKEDTNKQHNDQQCSKVMFSYPYCLIDQTTRPEKAKKHSQKTFRSEHTIQKTRKIRTYQVKRTKFLKYDALDYLVT